MQGKRVPRNALAQFARLRRSVRTWLAEPTGSSYSGSFAFGAILMVAAGVLAFTPIRNAREHTRLLRLHYYTRAQVDPTSGQRISFNKLLVLVALPNSDFAPAYQTAFM